MRYNIYMFFNLLILFTVVPIVELVLLVNIGERIGTLNTIAIVIITGVAGASFAKSQGVQVIGKIKETMAQGQLPGMPLLEGAMVLVGAAMLITPGFITDIVGLSLLFPWTRVLYARLAGAYFKRKFQSGQFQFTTFNAGGFPTDEEDDRYNDEYDDGEYENDDIIDVEEEDESEPPKLGGQG